MNIDSVPESISREKYTEMIKSLGFDPNRLVSLHWGLYGITAEVLAFSPDGHAIIDNATDDIMRHYVVIPIKG